MSDRSRPCPPPARRGARAAVAVAAAVVLLAPTVPAGAAPRSPVPEIAWSGCGDDPALAAFECAEVEVPTDHDRPRGATTTIALTRLPATDPQQRIGSLFTNPGGPGGSGVDFVQQLGEVAWTPEVRARFDVIGFDPRGVGGSDPATCFRTEARETAFFADQPAFPVTARQEAVATKDAARLAVACQTTSGDRFAHMSTANVARDMDLLREALGDDRLSYVGYSYGTYLGATYARLFPDRVRALVLDGTVDPAAYSGSDGDRRPLTLRMDQHLGGDEVFTEFLEQCRQAGPSGCALAALGDAEQVAEGVLARLREQPLVVTLPDGSTLTLTYDLAVTLTFFSLYEPAQWPLLAAELAAYAQAQEAGEAAVALEAQEVPAALAAFPLRKDEYASVGSGLGLCSETARTRRPLAFPRFADAADAEAPHFGRMRAWTPQVCDFWTVRDRDAYTGPWQQDVDGPVLVVGTRFDPATPYRNTRPYADLFPDGRLLTLDGWGHTVLGKSACADEAVARYLVDLEATDGAVCAPDAGPFDPPAPVARSRSGGQDVQLPGDRLPQQVPVRPTVVRPGA
jgi:pimeloyl-ACP methyl ester carboxylesterase